MKLMELSSGMPFIYVCNRCLEECINLLKVYQMSINAALLVKDVNFTKC